VPISPTRSAIATDRSGEPFTRATPSASSTSSRSTSSCSAGRVEQLLPNLLRGREDRAAVVEGRLRPARPHVPRRDVGVLVQDRDVVRIDAELLTDEHRHRHHGAAAVLLRAGHDRCAAVAVHLHVRAGRRGHAWPPADGDTDRLVVGQVAAVADHLDRALERVAHTDLLEDLTGRALGALLDQRPTTEVDGVHADRGRDLVHVLLECPAHLRRGGCADRPGGLVVRVVQVCLDRDVVDLVRAARVHRRHLPEEPALAAVRALVEHELRPACDEASVSRDGGLELHRDPLTALGDDREFLLAGQDQA
jgi:hypothetical protein